MEEFHCRGGLAEPTRRNNDEQAPKIQTVKLRARVHKRDLERDKISGNEGKFDRAETRNMIQTNCWQKNIHNNKHQLRNSIHDRNDFFDNAIAIRRRGSILDVRVRSDK